ncbi:UxaA family hydrolase (plasmid) [Deinococcus radiomollis]|uniref:UxaA family hydrolase n=1 Tax=Deinococcus radiomollis TaxID=468916 RepID=UPI00389168BB
MNGYLRQDGRKGIRNVLLVAYLVECAHHVSREIATLTRDQDVQLIGFSGCYPNSYAQGLMERLCTHPNVGGVLLVSLGCEGFNRHRLAESIRESGRPVQTLVIQERGGTRKTIAEGTDWIRAARRELEKVPRVAFTWSDLIVGTVCGGSDGTSGISANPAVGGAFDTMVGLGSTCIFEETGELIGCEAHMAGRAITPELGRALVESVHKAARYYTTLGHGSFAPGNADGGLTTQEEKSLGAYAKSGSGPIHGLIRPGETTPAPGLYLMDVVPDGEVRFGFPNINDTSENIEMIASGAHLILFTTGRGSVVGSAISPVIKVCGNPETYRRMQDDMDVNAGAILEGTATLPQVSAQIVELVGAVAGGVQSASESLGHQEFVLTYKTFEASGPACLPLA